MQLYPQSLSLCRAADDRALLFFISHNGLPLCHKQPSEIIFAVTPSVSPLPPSPLLRCAVCRISDGSYDTYDTSSSTWCITIRSTIQSTAYVLIHIDTAIQRYCSVCCVGKRLCPLVSYCCNQRSRNILWYDTYGVWYDMT